MSWLKTQLELPIDQVEAPWKFGKKEELFLENEGFSYVGASQSFKEKINEKELYIFVGSTSMIVDVMNPKDLSASELHKQYIFNSEPEFHSQYRKLVEEVKEFFRIDKKKTQMISRFVKNN